MRGAGLVVAKHGMGPGVDPISANLLRVASGLMGLVIFSIARGRLVSDFSKMRDLRSLLLISSGSLLGPVLGMILTLAAFKMAPLGVVTSLMQMSPIMLLPFDKFVLKARWPARFSR